MSSIPSSPWPRQPVVPIDNYEQPMQPVDWVDHPEWIWYNDDGGYDD